ncbi:hypothetical protein PQX77_020936 [Marasmius sp. AFHP31]|nr:hypothetical protein PQX77_020936 [Marasmius sp. AFHP31]
MLRGRHRHIIGLVILAAFFYGTSLLLKDTSMLVNLLGRQFISEPEQEPMLIEDNPPPDLSPPEQVEVPTHVPRPVGEGTANATLVFLARNSELDGVLSSMEHVETRFNKRFGYPWVFLNEVEFEDEFKRRVQEATSAPVSFGLIPHDHWYQPDWVDEDRAREGREKMKALNMIYADNVPYRNMCRFNSGFFFHHPLLQPYRYYWRVEPGISYTCDIPYDPFDYLRDHGKIYGFTITFTEWEATIPTLWASVKEFVEKYPQYVSENNAMSYLSKDGGKTYNLCHFWSNFEIADLDFWRSEAYQKFFEFLDSKGGFYYERWGDAPVHSIAAALFADKEKLHFFNDIGYSHPPFEHCPAGELRNGKNCNCNPAMSIDRRPQSCLTKYEKLW